MNKRMWSMIVVCVLCSFGGTSWAVPIVADNFEDPTVNTALWTPYTSGSGIARGEYSGKLHVDFEANASDGPDGAIIAGYQSTCKARGDFDIQVDFDLLGSPLGNGTRTALVLQGSGPITMERSSYGPVEGSVEVYVTNFGNVIQRTLTSDRSGTLRLVRSGSEAIAYYQSGSGWIEARRGPVTTDDVNLYLQSWSHNERFANVPVHNAFDNFLMNTGQMVGCHGTTIQADPAVLEALPGSGVATTLRATLRDTVGTPLVGFPIQFSWGSTIVCKEAFTDGNGVATCGMVGDQLNAVVHGSWDATFLGYQLYKSSSGHGNLVTVGGNPVL